MYFQQETIQRVHFRKIRNLLYRGYVFFRRNNMAKKVFYNKRRKVPKGLQIYLVWAVVMSLLLPFLIIFGIDTVKPAKAIETQDTITGKQAAILYYKLKEVRPTEKQKIIQEFLAKLQMPGFRKETRVSGGFSCPVVVFTRGNPIGTLVFSVPYSIPDFSENALVRALSLSENIVRAETGASFTLVLYENSCDISIPNLIQVLGQESPKGIIRYLPGGKQIIPATGIERVSSQFWQNVIPLKDKFNMKDHFYQSLLKAEHSQSLLAGNTPGYTIYGVSGEKYPTAKAVVKSQDLFTPVLIAFAQETERFANSGMWISNTRHGKSWSIIMVSVFVFILLFFPVMHGIGLRKENLSLIDAGLSIILFSLPGLVFLVFFRGGGNLFADKNMLLGISFLLWLFVYVVIRRFKTKVFSFHIQGSSVILLLALLQFPLLFKNCGWLFLTIPVILLLSVAWRTGKAVSILAMMLAAVYIGLNVMGFAASVGSLYAVFVQAYPSFTFINAFHAIWFLLISGGFLSLTVREIL